MTLKRPFCTCKPSVNLAYAAGALVSVSSARAGSTVHTMRAQVKKMNGTNRFILHPSRFTERKKEEGAPLGAPASFPPSSLAPAGPTLGRRRLASSCHECSYGSATDHELMLTLSFSRMTLMMFS